MGLGLRIPHLPSRCFQLTPRFKNHCSRDISGQILLGTALCTIGCFRSILGLSPLHVNSNLSSCGSQNVSRHCLCPLGEKITPIWELLAYSKKYQLYIGFLEWHWVWLRSALPEPEGWMMALFILTNCPGPAWLLVAKIMDPRLWKNSSLLWTWHIETNPAKWFKHYFVVWVQFRDNM